MRWIIADSAPQEFTAQFPELPAPVLQLLWNRGIKDAESIGKFLEPDWSRDVHDPFLFRDMRRATERLVRAIERDERIVIHGDYDADGVSASAILYTALKALGAKNVEVFLPHRERDGYGLHKHTIDSLLQPPTSSPHSPISNIQYLISNTVLITCDCGISNREEIGYAAECGIDVIVTDHHTIPPQIPERAYAILHPKLPGETYPDQTLSGGGVAFKLAQALLRRTVLPFSGGQSSVNFEKWLLDLVAISSVADMVPLQGETRTLVKYGLIVLNKTRRLGLRKLIEAAGLTLGALDATDIGFRIAPRINAAGRMDHANLAFELLTSEDEREAEELAKLLNNHNSDRRERTDDILEEARAQVVREAQHEHPIIFVYSPEWPLGLVGLVASKLKDEFSRPALVMAGHERITGSGRSIPELNIIETLRELEDCFLKVGGHPQACGFTLREPSMLPAFEERLRTAVGNRLKGVELVPTLTIDAEAPLSTVDWNLLSALDRMAPYGIGNPEPTFSCRGLEVLAAERIGNDGKHLRLLVSDGEKIKKTIGFSKGEFADQLQRGDRIDLAFELGRNEWNGEKEIQIAVKDIKRN